MWTVFLAEFNLRLLGAAPSLLPSQRSLLGRSRDVVHHPGHLIPPKSTWYLWRHGSLLRSYLVRIKPSHLPLQRRMYSFGSSPPSLSLSLMLKQHTYLFYLQNWYDIYPDCGYIASYAQDLVDDCWFWMGPPDTINRRQGVCGQLFDTDSYNVVVTGQWCWIDSHDGPDNGGFRSWH